MSEPTAERHCGDLLDSFPCVVCKARTPLGCVVPKHVLAGQCELLNSVEGLANKRRAEVGRIRKAGKGRWL